MEYGRVPAQYLKADCLLPEDEYAQKNKAEIRRKATPEDIAKIEAEIAAKAKRTSLSVSISAEMSLERKPEPKPEHMYEAMPNRPKAEWLQYRPVMFDAKKVG